MLISQLLLLYILSLSLLLTAWPLDLNHLCIKEAKFHLCKADTTAHGPVWNLEVDS